MKTLAKNSISIRKMILNKIQIIFLSTRGKIYFHITASQFKLFSGRIKIILYKLN